MLPVAVAQSLPDCSAIL